MKHNIYLDNAATTKPSETVLQRAMPFLKEEYGNPNSIYSFGATAREAVNRARNQVAFLINAKPQQIVFTSSGSEANNLVIKGTRKYCKSINKSAILISAIEHDSINNAADQEDCTVFRVYPNSFGVIEAQSVKDILDCHPEIGLVSIMNVNNEIGSINPIIDIGEVCSKKDVLFHTDCVQSLGFEYIDVDDIKCDFLTMSAHKIHGIKGAGALFVKDKEVLEPIINGGSSQEWGLRGGTQAVFPIVVFGEACEYYYLAGNVATERFIVDHFRRHFYLSLHKEFKKKGCDFDELVEIIGDPFYDAGKILTLRFKGIDAETLLLKLSTKGVFVSAGSACESNESKPSRVLKAIGLKDDEARECIRFSFSHFNTEKEIEKAAKIVVECVISLKELSC